MKILEENLKLDGNGDGDGYGYGSGNPTLI